MIKMISGSSTQRLMKLFSSDTQKSLLHTKSTTKELNLLTSANVTFDELADLASEHVSSELVLSGVLDSEQISLGHVPQSDNPNHASTSKAHVSDLDLLFENFYDEYFGTYNSNSSVPSSDKIATMEEPVSLSGRSESQVSTESNTTFMTETSQAAIQETTTSSDESPIHVQEEVPTVDSSSETPIVQSSHVPEVVSSTVNPSVQNSDVEPSLESLQDNPPVIILILVLINHLINHFPTLISGQRIIRYIRS